jgi:hypothetical protein
MKKTLFVLVAIAFATAAYAKAPDFTQQNWSQNITVNATIQQSVSCQLGATEINFNVSNPSAETLADTTASISCTASVAKGHSAFITITSSDLIGAKDGMQIPANLVWGKSTGAADFRPLDSTAYYTPVAMTASAGTLNLAGLNTTMSFKLKPVAAFVPDQYTGTVTVLVQVV